MKYPLPNNFLIIVATISLFMLAGCDPNAIATNIADANKKEVGRWLLVSITSGWTGKVELSTEKIELTIDDNQQGIFYKNGVEVSRYRYKLEDTSPGFLRYRVTQQSGIAPVYLLSDAFFSVNSQQLVIDGTHTDGPAYMFSRY